MENSLHRDLKRLYGDQSVQFEVVLGAHRIDVVAGGRLVEIQVASLAAIRDKVRILVEDHHVVVVKPIIVQKTLVKRMSKDGPVAQRRKSPKRGTIFDLFDSEPVNQMRFSVDSVACHCEAGSTISCRARSPYKLPHPLG
jgi:hypothetical protein